MKKEWFFDRFLGKRVVAYAEDGVLTELGIEDEDDSIAIGNIYLGKVQNIVSGMQAAFVSCGLGRNCYLPLNEDAALLSTYDGTEGSGEKVEIREGDEILVQVVKLPRGGKGAKVTRDLSFVGKNLIYLPRTDFLGISRKITDADERERLLNEGDKLRGKGTGLIMRTAAKDAERRRLKAEKTYLEKVYRAAIERAKSAPAGTAVYRECSLPVKVMRDSIGSDPDRIVVGDKELYDQISELAKMRSDLKDRRIVFYGGERALFTEFGVSDQIYALSSAQVTLENGAYLVVDRTEAMTVIDVNTGSFVGKDDLESTVFETNLLAAKEIARLVRLRNIGGIVAVDFIDMLDEAHKRAVEDALASACGADRSKCRIFPMNELCVLLFTRKRTENDVLASLLKPCAHCAGRGCTGSDLLLAMRLRSGIMEYFSKDYRAVIIELNRSLMNRILSERYFSKEIRGRWRDKVVYMIPHSSWSEEKFTLRGENAPVLTLPDHAQILY